MSAWHYQHNGESKGPVTDEQLKALCEAGVVTVATAVWQQGYADWMALGDTDFQYIAQAGPPTIGRSGVSGAHGTHKIIVGDYEVENISMWGYFKRCLTSKYFGFEGRARRKEYWSFALFYVITFFVVIFVGLALDFVAGNIVPGDPDSRPIFTTAAPMIFFLGMLLPSLAVLVRRIHDLGLTGWLVLIGLIPLGALALFIMALIPTQFGPNKHGPAPKAPPGV